MPRGQLLRPGRDGSVHVRRVRQRPVHRVGVHGVGGMWGAIATGLWAVKSVNGVDGLFAGNPGQLLIQLNVMCGELLAYMVSSLTFPLKL